MTLSGHFDRVGLETPRGLGLASCVRFDDDLWLIDQFVFPLLARFLMLR
jgi:hypothetical protein